jgi:predicted MFS family arabinose efflux permease
LIILMLVTALNLADRQGLAALAPALKVDLKLSDTQLGLIQGLGFAIFYTLLGWPLARLAEHHSRARVIAGSIAVFSAFLLLASQARSFGSILLARVGVGAGDAGFGPPVASLVGDLFPSQQRASAMTVLWLGAPVGAAIGAIGGGWVAQTLGWRSWFAIIGVVSVCVALLAMFALREPRRGMFDAVEPTGKPPSIGTTLRFLLAKRSMVHVFIGAGLAATGMNGLGQFWGRYFVAVHHVSLSVAGQIIGLIAVVSMACGFALGGFGIGFLARRDPRCFVWGPGAALAVTTPLLLLGVTRPDVVGTTAILLLAHAAMFLYYTPTLTLAMNMVGANMRASSAFLLNVVLGLIGVGLGPTIIGALSDFLAGTAFKPGEYDTLCVGGVALADASAQLQRACDAASASGILQAVKLTAFLFIWASAHYLLASLRVREDLTKNYVS